MFAPQPSYLEQGRVLVLVRLLLWLLLELRLGVLFLSPEFGENGSAEEKSRVGAATSIMLGTATYVAASSFSPASALFLVSALVLAFAFAFAFPLALPVCGTV